jgi:predicted dehydrogenase
MAQAAERETKGASHEDGMMEIPYLPKDPEEYDPEIALIGCGGITPHHLRAYKKAGYRVTALCDIDRDRAEVMRRKFYPKARIYTDHRQLLDQESGIEVVDVATHPEIRSVIVEEALRARKHVLSQKPFVIDLDRGEELVALSDEMNVRLAVNQNGRWAPHFSWMRHAIQAGVAGQVVAMHTAVHWDHNWTAGTAFDAVRHLILYDFGIHWFDMLTCVMGDRTATRVYASMALAHGQKAKPPLLAQALVEYPDAQATIGFDGSTPFGKWDHTEVIGSAGTMIAQGPDYEHQKLAIFTQAGKYSPRLKGKWFQNGFHGTMAELLCAIEEGRQPSNNARENLKSLALCFAATVSAEQHEPVVPGAARKMPGY